MFLLFGAPAVRAGQESTARTGQQRFKFDVVKRYGARCAVCNVSVPGLLDAAHLRPKAKNGSDDPRNGLVMCPLHHRALDGYIIGIEPETLQIVAGKQLDKLASIGVARTDISHLTMKPHPDALTWLWDKFCEMN